MKAPVTVSGSAVTYLLTTLCNHGEYGDYQAFPASPLALDLVAVGQRLKAAGAGSVRTNGQRLAFEWSGVAVTLFSAGRIILEHVVPDRQAAAAGILKAVLESPGAES
jgi:hypothetical protein